MSEPASSAAAAAAPSGTIAGAACGQCTVCDVDAALKCTACKVTFYCGAEHQRQHWKDHKPLCQRPFAVEASAVVATRDIAAHSVIFVEAPLVVGPKWTADEDLERADLLPCVGCFRPVQLGRGRAGDRCPGCAWPACSAECAGLNDPQRHAVECAALSMDRAAAATAAADSRRAAADYYRSDALLALRCVLLQVKFPQRWAQLLELPAHEEQRKGTPNYEDADQRIVAYLQTRFLDRFQAATTAAHQQTDNRLVCDTATLQRVCGIIEANALNITLEHSGGLEVGGVFATASRLGHSCLPNCSFAIEPFGQHRLTMRAGRDIRSGERLSVMRTHMLWGTQMRHEHLLQSRYVVCDCERCTDPTELGTYVSALRCIGDENAECSGSMLPVAPQDPATEWRCDVCPMRCDNEQIAFVLTNIADEVDGLLLNREAITVLEVETMIGKLAQLLHPHHYHLVALQHSLVQLYGSHKGYEADRLSAEQLRRKVDMCEQLLRLLDVLDPHAIRLSLYIAIVLYEMQAAVVELERRRKQRALEEDVKYDYEGLYVAEGYLVRAKRVLENGGDTPQGRKFVESVVRASEELETMFEGIKV